MFLKPMLAPSTLAHRSNVWFPILASEKMNGIRCLVYPVPPFLISRNGKTFPNSLLYSRFRQICDIAREHDVVLDGEIWAPGLGFGTIQSQVMSKSGDLSPSLGFWAFDCVDAYEWKHPRKNFYERLEVLKSLPPTEGLSLTPQYLCGTWEEVVSRFETVVSTGGEGLMLRDPYGPYKHGRCTVREQNMLKMKPQEIAVGEVIAVEPLQAISPDAHRTYDLYGHPERITSKANLIEKDLLGRLVARSEGLGVFRVGSGFNLRGGDKDRRELWKIKSELIGRKFQFKYIPVEIKDHPIAPVFLKWL